MQTALYDTVTALLLNEGLSIRTKKANVFPGFQKIMMYCLILFESFT